MFKAYLLFTFVLGENCNSLKRWLIYIRVIGNSPVKLPFVWLRFSSLGFPKNCSPFLIFSMLETICSLLILWWKSTPRTFSLARLKMCSIHAAISISFYMCVIKSVHDASFPQRLFLPGGCPTKPLWPIRTSQPPLLDPPQQKTKKKLFHKVPLCRFLASLLAFSAPSFCFLLPTQILTCQMEPLTLLDGARTGTST